MSATHLTRWEHLPREQVIRAVERRGPTERIPMVHAKWWGEGLREQYGERLAELEGYPEDTAMIWCPPVEFDKMGLSWTWKDEGARDARPVLDDWAKLDEFIAKLPDPEADPRFEQFAVQAEAARRDDYYLLFGWWLLFFERPWAIRGMQNLLLDYYLFPAEVHRLNDALCTLYCGYIRRAARELRPDGLWTSDDLGHQTQLMMPPRIFREFLKPNYIRVGRVLDEVGMHFWLHSCGNNTEILGDLADAGLDVFHPVQKGTMDEIAVAREFGDRLTFLAGIDVQHTLQEKDPAGVREEVRFLVDTFDRPDGGMLIAAGNGIVGGTPFENIRAFLDESAIYGRAHRARFAGRG
jgi:uroporphyrinogen decarboxylase